MNEQVLIYAFLSERVYIIWTGGNQVSRFKTKVYRLCAFVMLGYIVVVVLMIVGREGTIREDDICIIGLRSYSTISLIVYDFSLNIFLTTMFLFPLWRSHPMSPRLRSVAKRTLYGACTSLISSAVNFIILFLLGGNELGWVCLSSCVTDSMINALALFWVSSSPYPSHIIRDRFSLPTMDMSALTFVHAESSSARPTEHALPTTMSALETLQAIPEAYYDYIPLSKERLRTTVTMKQYKLSHFRTVEALAETSFLS
ncbi:hypothetical protein D9757_002592 [Collybiopsis confluens]|uniref:Transmembrane protein n=1 Tax=Collybiopsis confluens TaxID=2823264 RepID=A0A8H5HWB3_9AGAR|nr:hypothetical protein D9757_002592 [Collybiopsis confluens]